MLLNLDSVRPAAKAAFEKVLREKVEWISTRCWPDNLATYLKDLNGIIAAGVTMEVTTARQFTEKEVLQLADLLSPLRTLDMKKETRLFLIATVCALGVDPAIFEEKGNS